MLDEKISKDETRRDDWKKGNMAEGTSEAEKRIDKAFILREYWRMT